MPDSTWLLFLNQSSFSISPQFLKYASISLIDPHTKNKAWTLFLNLRNWTLNLQNRISILIIFLLLLLFMQKEGDESKRDAVVLLLQDMLEVVTRDMMVNESRYIKLKFLSTAF